jgi:hypothetical protein
MSDGFKERTSTSSSKAVKSAAWHFPTQISSEVRLPEPWKPECPPLEIPRQTWHGKPLTSSMQFDERHTLQVKNTFFDIVSQPGSEKSNEKVKESWTDERAGLMYGSYENASCPQWVMKMPAVNQGVSPRHKTPSVKSGLASSISSHSLGSSKESLAFSRTRSGLSAYSSEGDGNSEMVVVLAGDNGRFDNDKSVSEVRVSEFQKVPRHPTTGEITSIGSAEHFCGNCKPCEWMQRGRPCKYGWRCPYCHIVDEHTGYRRKRQQSQSLSKHQTCSPGLKCVGRCGTPSQSRRDSDTRISL